MKPMSFREVVNILSNNGFNLYKDSKHKIYKNEKGYCIAVPHTREVSPGTLRDIMKHIAKAKSTNSAERV